MSKFTISAGGYIMKIKIVFMLGAVLSLLLAQVPARAAGDTGVYIAPRLSYNIHSFTDMDGRGFNRKHNLDSGYDQNFGGSFAVGYDIFTNYSLPARVEVEGYYLGRGEESGRTQNLGGGDFNYSLESQAKGLFLNGYFDLHNSSIFTPYIGGGIGPSWVRSNGHLQGSGTPANTETNLAWNVALGMAAELNYNASVEFGYRYARFGEARTGISARGEYLDSTLGVHQIMLGLRYGF